jgi:hypothetical protein
MAGSRLADLKTGEYGLEDLSAVEDFSVSSLGEGAAEETDLAIDDLCFPQNWRSVVLAPAASYRPQSAFL